MKKEKNTTKRSGVLWVLILSVAITVTTAPVIGQVTDTGVTGAGAGSFPDGAAFNGIPLRGLELGQGIFIAADGTASGEFHVVLLGTSFLGQPQDIVVEGKVSNGSSGPNGSVTFSGVATVDVGDGTLPLVDVPFTVTATSEGLLLGLGTSTLPPATLTAGSITIE